MVYPRVCGEAILIVYGTEFDTGLSPRVRGSLDRVRARNPLRGSIPACAGKPRPLVLAQ